MILLQISGTPYPFFRSFVNNAGVHKDYYRGRWRHVCDWEPMFTRKQASEDTLMMVPAEEEWPGKKGWSKDA